MFISLLFPLFLLEPATETNTANRPLVKGTESVTCTNTVGDFAGRADLAPGTCTTRTSNPQPQDRPLY